MRCHASASYTGTKQDSVFVRSTEVKALGSISRKLQKRIALALWWKGDGDQLFPGGFFAPASLRLKASRRRAVRGRDRVGIGSRRRSAPVRCNPEREALKLKGAALAHAAVPPPNQRPLMAFRLAQTAFLRASAAAAGWLAAGVVASTSRVTRSVMYGFSW